MHHVERDVTYICACMYVTSHRCVTFRGEDLPGVRCVTFRGEDLSAVPSLLLIMCFGVHVVGVYVR